MNPLLETRNSELETSPVLHRELYPEASLPLDAENAPPNTLDFRSSDQTLDRYQEVISVKGWKLENYLRNPVVQNAHSYSSLADTIGKAIITEIRGVRPSSGAATCPGQTPRETNAGTEAAQIANQKSESALSSDLCSLTSPFLFQRVVFAVAENPLAKLAFGLYKGGFLKAVSVGFIPLRWENGTKEAGYRRKYLEQELLEVSAVSIPANPNAITMALKAGAVEKSDLRELFDLLKHSCGSALGISPDAEPRILNLIKQVKEIRAILRKA